MKKIVLNQNEVCARSKYILVSSNKVRRILRQIQGKSYQQALILLKFMPYTVCTVISKVLRSAAANAKNNLGFDEKKLLVKAAFSDQGPVIKRFQPRAQGRAYRILKPTSHITIILTQ